MSDTKTQENAIEKEQEPPYPRLKKIKLNRKTCAVECEAYLLDDWYERKVSGPAAKVTDDFRQAIAALSPAVLRICETDDCWLLENVTPIGLSISYVEGELYGVTITALYKLEESNAPLVINTPHQQIESEQDDAKGVLTVGEANLIEAVMEHAQRYLAGDRRAEPKQLDIFAEPEANT
jgi:hypothetical protein